MNKNSIKSTKDKKLQSLIKRWAIDKRLQAKESILSKDRANTELTEYEIYDKMYKHGYVLKYRNISLHTESGMGCLTKANGNGVVNATLKDFVNEIYTVYGKKPYWARG